jgi:hypothetical protein
MSDEYQAVRIDLPETGDDYPDVHLSVNGVKLDLPNLKSTDLPIELVQVVLMIKSKLVLSDEENAAAMSVFLAYFQSMQPNFWNVLRKTGHAMEWLVGTVKAWADQSGIDPKALS